MKLTKEEKRRKFAQDILYSQVYGECAGSLRSSNRLYHEAIGIWLVGDRIVSKGDDLGRILRAQGYLLHALVEDMARLITEKDNTSLDAEFERRVNEWLEKDKKEREEQKRKREERKKRRANNG